MVEYLRPDADSVDGGWTDAGGGTTLFSSVDESSFNDADYIKSGASPVNDAVKLRLSDAASVLIGGIVRYRLWKTGAEVMNAAVRLLQGATEIARWDHSAITGTATTFSQTLTGPEFAAISDLDDLFIEINANPILTPLEIFGANLVWHVDASVAGSMFSNVGHTTPVADTDRIRWWDDQSASGAHLVNLDSDKTPMYEAAGLNGEPTASFDLGLGLMERTDIKTGATAIPLNSAALSCFVVVKVGSGAGSSDRFLSFNAGNGDELSANSFILLWNDPNFYAYSGGSIIGNGGAVASLADNTPAVIGLVLDGANAHLYKNGVEQGAATAKTTTMGYSGGNQMYLSPNTQRIIARMPECILVDRAATGPEIASLQAYFASKWGL